MMRCDLCGGLVFLGRRHLGCEAAYLKGKQDLAEAAMEAVVRNGDVKTAIVGELLRDPCERYGRFDGRR